MSSLFALLLLAVIAATAAQDSPTVSIPGLGILRGTIAATRGNRTVLSFLGIPYAKSPSGERRFLPPEDMDPWEGVLNATEPGRQCPQMYMEYEEGDVEDCLSLDVYTREISENARYPVLIYIHGGGLTAGSSLLNSAYLMDEEIVLVSIQYRLGLLGYLSLQTEEIPGNAGFLDQLKAMQWVQSHIQVFSGDPNQVTLVGQSAGAISVNCHMISPLSRGLFHQAIMMSGSILSELQVNRNPVNTAMEVAGILNCSLDNLTSVAACFRSTPAEDLVMAANQYEQSYLHSGKEVLSSSAVIQTAGDVRFFQEDPIELYQSGNYYKVPLLAGSTKHEALYSFLSYADVYLERNNFTSDVQLRKDGLVEALLLACGIPDPGHVLVDAIQEMYFGNASMENFQELIPGIVDLLTVLYMKGKTYRAMQINSRYETSFWYAFNFYQSQYAVPNKYNIAGVSHGAEGIYFTPMEGVELDEKGEEFSIKLIKLFTNFVIYGNPTSPENPVAGVPEWPPYTSEGESYLRMDEEFVVLQDFKKEFTISSQEGLPHLPS